MTPIRKANRQCGDKLRFDSEVDAAIAIAENHGRSPTYNAYLCPHCEFWHVGHAIRDAA